MEIESQRSRIRHEEATQKQQDLLSEAQQEAIEREEREGPPSEEEEMEGEMPETGMPPPPEGGMPEDPLQAEQAAQRLQGGPEAGQVQQREFEENAPE